MKTQELNIMILNHLHSMEATLKQLRGLLREHDIVVKPLLDEDLSHIEAELVDAEKIVEREQEVLDDKKEHNIHRDA